LLPAAGADRGWESRRVSGHRNGLAGHGRRMSKARLVSTAVVIEGRSQGEVARAYGVSQGWVSRLVARYRAEGEAAFEPRSRRPKTSPNAISADTVELVVLIRKELAGQGLDAGPDTICWHLRHHHQVSVAPATVSRYLTRHGLVIPEPRKRPKSSWIRFVAELPNQRWQSDFTHWQLSAGTETEILSWLDDHSRYALRVTAHQRVTGPIVRDAFRAAVAAYGAPAGTLTDNGMVFTTRFSGGKGGRNHLEHELRRLGVEQKNGKPNHPRKPRARSNASSRPLRNGSPPSLPQPPSPSCRPSSTRSRLTTTTSGPTGRWRTADSPPSPSGRRAKWLGDDLVAIMLLGELICDSERSLPRRVHAAPANGSTWQGSTTVQPSALTVSPRCLRIRTVHDRVPNFVASMCAGCRSGLLRARSYGRVVRVRPAA
jgi:transposase InsO family protein